MRFVERLVFGPCLGEGLGDNWRANPGLLAGKASEKDTNAGSQHRCRDLFKKRSILDVMVAVDALCQIVVDRRERGMQRVIGQVSLQAVVGRKRLTSAREFVEAYLFGPRNPFGERVELRAIGFDVRIIF